MKLSNTYKGYLSSELFKIDRYVFRTIVIANGEASCFVKVFFFFFFTNIMIASRFNVKQIHVPDRRMKDDLYTSTPQ